MGYTVTQITVSPTRNDANATLEFLDGSDNPLTDADGSTDGLQVDLAVGANTIKVQLTAEDGFTVNTYALTVTRTAEDTSLSPPASDPVAASPSTAVYDVVFQGTWTVAATPGGVPGGAHFSRLIGGVHSDDVTFLESAGVESMAEVGGWTGLQGEVQNAGSGALSVLRGDTDSISPTTSKSLTATLTTEHPRVTLTTMVAPSPDWFVGVSGLPLLDDQGRWLHAHEVNLYPWDAGTEDGSEFSLTNLETNPRGVITSIRGTGKFSTERIASLSFTLRSGSTTRSVAENTAAGVDIGAAVTAAAHGGTVTYILGGSDAASFDIVAATGQIQTKAALDYEIRSSYEVTVTATDADGSVTTTVAIEVTNTTVNSATAQTVTVTAGNDADTTNDTVSLTHSAASTDIYYQGITIAGVTVTVAGNDTAQVTGVMVEPGNAQLVVDWTAVTNATGYKVQWKSGGQSYNTSSQQATITSGSPTSRTITNLSNGTAYTVRVIATRTGANDGPPSAAVVKTPVMPTTAGVTVSKSALTVTEKDATGDGYTVVLDSQPSANVTVTVAGHASTDVTPAPASLSFTTGNWQTPQTVTVTAGADTDLTNDTVSLSHSAASSDSAYQGITIAGVTVTVAGNDTVPPPPPRVRVLVSNLYETPAFTGTAFETVAQPFTTGITRAATC